MSYFIEYWFSLFIGYFNHTDVFIRTTICTSAASNAGIIVNYDLPPLFIAPHRDGDEASHDESVDGLAGPSHAGVLEETDRVEELLDLEWIARLLVWDDARLQEWARTTRAGWKRSWRSSARSKSKQ